MSVQCKRTLSPLLVKHVFLVSSSVLWIVKAGLMCYWKKYHLDPVFGAEVLSSTAVWLLTAWCNFFVAMKLTARSQCYIIISIGLLSCWNVMLLNCLADSKVGHVVRLRVELCWREYTHGRKHGSFSGRNSIMLLRRQKSFGCFNTAPDSFRIHFNKRLLAIHNRKLRVWGSLELVDRWLGINLFCIFSFSQVSPNNFKSCGRRAVILFKDPYSILRFVWGLRGRTMHLVIVDNNRATWWRTSRLKKQYKPRSQRKI